MFRSYGLACQHPMGSQTPEKIEEEEVENTIQSETVVVVDCVMQSVSGYVLSV